MKTLLERSKRIENLYDKSYFRATMYQIFGQEYRYEVPVMMNDKLADYFGLSINLFHFIERIGKKFVSLEKLDLSYLRYRMNNSADPDNEQMIPGAIRYGNMKTLKTNYEDWVLLENDTDEIFGIGYQSTSPRPLMLKWFADQKMYAEGFKYMDERK